MARKFGSFGKNVMKSIGRTGLAVTRDLMPNVSRSVKENKDFVVEKYKEVNEKPKNTDIKTTFLYKTTKSLIDNALEDLKNGNFNNEERQKKAETESFANMFGLDLNMFDDDYSLDSGEEDVNVASFNIDADFSEETVHDIKSIAKMGGANLKVLNLGMNNLTYQLSSMTHFYNENTTRFYETIEEKLNDIASNLDTVSSYYKDLFENNKKGMRGSGDSTFADFMGLQGVSIREWIEYYKKANDSGSSELIKMLLDMGKAQYSNLAANPLGYISKTIFKGLMPKRLKNTMTKFDEMFGLAPILLQGLSNSNNSILKLFGGMFKLDKFKIKNKSYKYEKGPVSFDGITKRAITQVIPGYLSKILTALSSRKQDKDLHYDYDSGKFVTRKDITKKFNEDSEDSMRYALNKSGTKTLKQKALEKAKEEGKINSDEDATSYEKRIDEALMNMSKEGKSFHSIKDNSEISKDSNIADLLMESYKNMAIEEKRKVVSNMGSAFIDHQRFLEEAYSNSMYQQAFDYNTIESRNKSEAKIKIDDISSRVKNKMNDVREKIDGQVSNSTAKKILDFFTSEKETKLDKKLNKVYDYLLDPLNSELNIPNVNINDKIKDKFKKASKFAKNIDKNDLKKHAEKAKKKKSNPINNDMPFTNEDLRNQHSQEEETGEASIIHPMFKDMMNTVSDIVNPKSSKKEKVIKVHIVGGKLDGVDSVTQVVNVDDADENDAPKAGSVFEQRKRMKKKETGSAVPTKENNTTDNSLNTTQEQSQEEGNSILETVDNIADISNALVGDNLLDKVANSKIGGKVSSILGKSSIGKGIKNGALELATNPKGLMGGIKTLAKGGLGKVAGLAKIGGLGAKATGLASTAGGALSTAASTAGAALPGLAASAGSALGGLGTAAAGALSAAAPFLLPALAAGGLAFGAYKLFKKKPKKDKNGNIIYDKDGNPVMESMAQKIGKGIKNFGKKLFGYKQKLDDDGNPIYDENGDPVYEKKKTLDQFMKTSSFGIFYGLTKKDEEYEEKDSKKAKAKEKTLDSLKRVYKFVKSGTFKKIFGVGGLFLSIFDGLLGKEGNLLTKTFKKLFGGLFDSASANVSGALDSPDATGSATPGSFDGGTYWDEAFAMVGREESGNDPGKISNISWDTGGKSYGAYQFSSNKGSLKSFVNWLGTQSDSKAKEYYQRLSSKTLASSAFDSEWKKIATEDRDGFLKLQQKRMKEAFYDVAVGEIKKSHPNFDPSKYTVGLNALILSTAIQYGPYTSVFKKVLNRVSNVNDEQALITAFRDVRKKSFPATSSRYDREYQTAMELYNKYKGKPFGDGTGGGSTGLNGAVGKSDNKQIQIALDTAKKMIDAGYPYKLEGGACNPSYGAFDCSGLMQYSYKQAGVNLPRITYDQVKQGKGIAITGQYGVGNAKPGDLLFCRPGSRGPEHVMMYAGGGMVYEAASSKTGLVHRSVANTSFASQPVAIRRIIGQGSNEGQSNNKIDNVGVLESQYKTMRHNENNNLIMQLRESLKKYSKTSKKRNEILSDIISTMKEMI